MELSKSCKYHLSSSLFLSTKTPQILATFLGPRLAFDMALSGGGRSLASLKNYYKCQKMTKVCLHLVYTSWLFTFYFSKFEEGWGCVFGTTCFLFEDTTAFWFKTKKEIIKPGIIFTFLGEEESHLNLWNIALIYETSMKLIPRFPNKHQVGIDHKVN